MSQAWLDSIHARSSSQRTAEKHSRQSRRPPGSMTQRTHLIGDAGLLLLAPQKEVQKMLCKRVDVKNFQPLQASMDLSSRARLRSCAGPLAGAWQWASPASPSERFEDSEYRRTSRSLLGQPVAEEGSLCQNVTRSGAYMGQVCNEMICAQGHHCYRCARGGGTKSRSADIEKVLMQILGGMR